MGLKKIGAKQKRLIIATIFTVIAIVTIAGCTAPNDEKPVGVITEEEYLTLSLDHSNRRIKALDEGIEDLDSFRDGSLSLNQFISRERERKIEYETILAELEQVTPPEEYKPSYNYTITSIEYLILNSEYKIEGFGKSDLELIGQAGEYMRLSTEYSQKATDALPV